MAVKQSPQLQAVQDQMRPGVLSRDGFLGSDPRNLVDILDQDDAAVKRLGRSHRAIAARMRELLRAGRDGLGDPVVFAPHFEVTVESYQGKLPCPFGHPGTFRKTAVTVVNTALDKTIRYTDLPLHLIEHHGFYQGRGAPYRLEPAELVEVLDVPRSTEEAAP